MRLNTYVNFAGRCAEAFRYYEEHLGATPGEMMTHAQAPIQGGGCRLNGRMPCSTRVCASAASSSWPPTFPTRSRCAAPTCR